MLLLTDLDEALPLLQENVELNSGNRSNVMTASTVSVESLCWGESFLPVSIERHVAASSRVVVVGADIIYRQNIFDPLLGTLKLLFATSKVSRCMIATQSIRQHPTPGGILDKSCFGGVTVSPTPRCQCAGAR